MWDQFKELIKRIPFVSYWIGELKVRSLPGFEGAPIYSVLQMLRQEIFSPTMSMKANAVAYSFFMSLFPALITLISLIPFVIPKNKKLAISDTVELYLEKKEVQQFLKRFWPETLTSQVVDQIDFFLNHKRSAILSLGFILTMYFSSSGVLSLMSNFEKSNSVFKPMGFFEKRLRAVGITAVLGVLMIASFTFIILGGQLVSWLAHFVQLDIVTQFMIVVIQWLAALLLFYFGIATIYRFGVTLNREQTFFSAGAATATALSLMTSVGFSFYVSHFGKYNAVYGSIGAIIVLMVWMQLNAMILIFGFELNAAIAVDRYLFMEDQRSREAPV